MYTFLTGRPYISEKKRQILLKFQGVAEMTRKCPFPTAPPLCSRLSHPPRYWATSRNTLCRTATGPWRAWSSSNGHRHDSRQCAVEKKMVRHMAAVLYALIGSISSAPLCSWKHWKVPPHVFQYTFYILVLAVFELIISGAYPSSLDSKAPYIKNEGSDSLTPFDLMLFWFSSCYIYVCQLAHAVKHRYAPILFSGINTSWNHSTFGQSILTSSLRRWLFFCPRGLWDSLVFHDRGAVEEGVSKDVTGGSFSSDPGEDPCFVSGCD